MNRDPYDTRDTNQPKGNAMYADSIDGTADVYDSRDIIARIESLKACEPSAEDSARLAELSARTDLTDEESDELTELESSAMDEDDKAELTELRNLASECEGYADWQYGETLIARSYWVDYIRELIDDCYEMPKDLDSGKWPYRHMTMDYDAAAKEAEDDYASVELFGNEYLIRNC